MSEAYQKIETKLLALRRIRRGATALCRLGHLALAWGTVLVLLLACAHSLWARLAFQALLNDPLTAIPVDRAWSMFNEMLRATKKMLPGWKI